MEPESRINSNRIFIKTAPLKRSRWR